LLAFAVMMLNTDLHNRNVRADRKMKLEDFIRNLRGIDGGSDVDPSILSAMYERIRSTEFMPGEDHVTQVMRVEQMLVGKKPQLSTVLYRRLVCYCRLQEVIDPGRRQRHTQHQREVFLFNDILLVAKIVGRHKSALSYSYRQSLPLSAMGVYLFESAYYRYGICLSNTTSDKVLIMLIARNEHDRRNFVDDLKEAILENSEMKAVENGECSIKEPPHEVLKHSNVNRYSNDSGVVDVDIIRTPDIAEVHRLSINGSSPNGRLRPHSVHNSVSGSDHGSAASLESGLNSVHVHGHNVGAIQLH
jgi:IQ motif/SEC7 domain-containing protein